MHSSDFYRAIFLAFVALPLLPGSEPAAALRNADPVYQALRTAPLAESFNAEGVTIMRDCATFQLKQGFLSFVAPQMGKVTLAVFTGTGEFSLDPVTPLEKSYLRLVSGLPVVAEPFSRAVFVFTDNTYEVIKRMAKNAPLDSAAASVLSQHRERVRKRSDDSAAAGVFAGSNYHSHYLDHGRHN